MKWENSVERIVFVTGVTLIFIYLRNERASSKRI